MLAYTFDFAPKSMNFAPTSLLPILLFHSAAFAVMLDNKLSEFPLALMEVLAQGSAHARPSPEHYDNPVRIYCFHFIPFNPSYISRLGNCTPAF